jgi:ribulose-5-phosphate 4-epimerase/fuculose-1-phosphate aldolase
MDDAAIRMSNSLRADLDDLARGCRILELEGHGDRVVGHMALRDPDGRGFWMKRAGIGLGEVYDARDFVLLDFDGNQLAGAGKPHNEWPIHSEILKRRPDINATLHTHPFWASLYSACEDPLPTVVPRATTQPVMPPRWEDSAGLVSTPEMGRSLAEKMGDRHYAVLLRNHGIAAGGPAIMDAVLVAIALDKMCREALTIAGSGLKYTSPDETALLMKMESGKGLSDEIVGHRTLWDYFCRKLARAEARGDPELATAPVPIPSR